MAKNPLKRNFTGLRSYTGKGGNKAARRAGQPVKDTRREEVSVYDIVLSHLIDEGYADTVKSAEGIMINMSEDGEIVLLSQNHNIQTTSQTAHHSFTVVFYVS